MEERRLALCACTKPDGSHHCCRATVTPGASDAAVTSVNQVDMTMRCNAFVLPDLLSVDLAGVGAKGCKHESASEGEVRAESGHRSNLPFWATFS